MSFLVNDKVQRFQQRDSFALLKRLLRISGISLDKNEPLHFKIYSVVILSINFYPLFQLVGAFCFLENGEEVFEFCIFEAVTSLILIKIIVLLCNRLLMGDILNKLQSGVFVPNIERGGAEEEILMNDCIALANKQAIVYWTVVTVTVIFALLDSAYSRFRSDDYHDWKFEYGRVTMFNTTYSPNYEIASLYQNISWFPMAWMFANSDLLTVTVLCHLTCQLRILQNSIRNIIPNSYKRMLKDKNVNTDDVPDSEINAAEISWRYIKPFAQDAVEYHLAIINIAQKIEDTFNLLVLLIMLSGIVLIGSLLYRLNGLHLGGVMCLMCEISLICFWGNEIMVESQNVLQACYDVNFFGSDLRFQRILFLMMERSKRPITLTAGKFTTLTLETFLWIVRATYSYLMILRRMDSKAI